MLKFFTPLSVLFAALSLTVHSGEPVYKAVGDEVVLTSDPVPDPITVIIWKHGLDMAVEWVPGSVPTYYRQFKERGHLNDRTGALTVTGLTLADSGTYTAEINSKETGTTELRVISRVSKPTVSTRCDADNTHCVFTCESNGTNTGPVTYSWIAKDKSWMSVQEIRITEEESEEEFHCELENPVSSEISDTVQNPFHVERRKQRSHLMIIICSVLFCIILVCGGVAFFLYRRNTRGEWRPDTERRPSGSNSVTSCNCSLARGSEEEAFLNDVPSSNKAREEMGMNDVPTSNKAREETGMNDVPTSNKAKEETGMNDVPTSNKAREETGMNDVPTSNKAKEETGMNDVPTSNKASEETEPEESPNHVRIIAPSTDTVNEAEETETANKDPASDVDPQSSNEVEEAAEQDAAGQDAAEQDAAEQDAAGQDAAGQDAAGQDAAEQDAAEQDAAEQDAAEQDQAADPPNET